MNFFNLLRFFSYFPGLENFTENQRLSRTCIVKTQRLIVAVNLRKMLPLCCSNIASSDVMYDVVFAFCRWRSVTATDISLPRTKVYKHRERCSKTGDSGRRPI